MRTFLIVLVIAVVAAAGIAGYIFFRPAIDDLRSSSQPGVVIDDPAEISARAIAFVQPPYRDDYGNMRVAGYIDNVGDRAMKTANISIELRSSEGDLEETIEHDLKNVPAGERTWFDIEGGTWGGPRTPSISVVSLEVVQ